MGENQKPLSGFTSSVERVGASVTTEQDLKEGYKKKGMGRGFTVVVIILLVLILGIGGYYLYKQYFASDYSLLDDSNSERSLVSSLKGNFPVKEITLVEIINEVEGDFNAKDGTCDDIDYCIADVKITYVRDSRISEEFILKDIPFNHGFTSLEEIYFNFADLKEIYFNLDDTGSAYYLLTYGSSNEAGTYLINSQGYVSKSFCSIYSSPSVLWDKNNLIFTDCGGDIGSEYKEIISGISVLNIESGNVTQIVSPVRGSGNQPEISYEISGVNYVESILTLNECRYTETTEECSEKDVDLTKVEVLK